MTENPTYEELLTYVLDLEKKLGDARSLTEDIMTYMTEGLVLTDTRGTVTFINQRLSEMLGYLPEEVVGKWWPDMVPDDQQTLAREAEARRAQGHKDRYEIILRRREGQRFPVMIGAGPRYDKQSREFVGTMGVVTDITERRRAEEAQETLQAQLWQAQKMESVGRLAGGVAHDFNNMLGVILGHAEFSLDKVGENHDLSAGLKEIQAAAMRSADLVKKLLAFARKQTISPRHLDLNDTVESMLTMLHRLIGEDIDLVWQPAAHVWSVKMDPSQIDQILANLCVNARDAIDAVDGVGKLTIETGRRTFDDAYCNKHPGVIPGEFVMLAVSDDGCGMDKEIQANLFEPFFTTKGVGKGTGLGLATIYGIVKQNNGFIDVYSEPGRGSTFKIYLPRSESM